MTVKESLEQIVDRQPFGENAVGLAIRPSSTLRQRLGPILCHPNPARQGITGDFYCFSGISSSRVSKYTRLDIIEVLRGRR